MIEIKQFAPDYPRVGKGVIDIPRDITLRKHSYPETVRHPAKNNMYLLEEIVKYLGDENSVVLDPMAGTGSIMYTASRVKSLFLIELEHVYAMFLDKVKASFGSNITVIEGDCRTVLPWKESIDLIVFSPPYANQIQQHTMTQGGRASSGAGDFLSHPDNLSLLPDFWFNQAMVEVYTKCRDSLKPGGHMVVIIKDRMKAGRRIFLSVQHMQMCLRASGLEVKEQYQHTHLGRLFGAWNKKLGNSQVEEEDIIIFMKGA